MTGGPVTGNGHHLDYLWIYGFIMKLITQVDKNNDLLVSVQFQFP